MLKSSQTGVPSRQFFAPLTYHHHSLRNFSFSGTRRKNVPGLSSTFPASTLEPAIPLRNLTPRFHLMDIQRTRSGHYVCSLLLRVLLLPCPFSGHSLRVYVCVYIHLYVYMNMYIICIYIIFIHNNIHLYLYLFLYQSMY